MATQTTDRTATGAVARYSPNNVFVDVATFECSTTAANDVIQMVPVAAGVTLVDLYIVFDDLGTGVTVDVGDGDDVDRYIDGADVATAAGFVRMNAATAFPRTYSAADTIDIKILGAAATGTITLVAMFTAESVDLA